MPLLVGFFKTLFLGIVGVFASWMSKRLAIAAAVAVVFVGMTASLVGALMGVAAGLTSSMPPIVGVAACWFWPENGNACIAAVLSGYVTRFIYDAGVAKIQLAFRF